MKQPVKHKHILVLIVILHWLMALAGWWSILWHLSAFKRLGADLPGITIMLANAATSGVPFISRLS